MSDQQTPSDDEVEEIPDTTSQDEDDFREEVNYETLIHNWDQLTMFKDDLFMLMQARNIGIVDVQLTQWEFQLRSLYVRDKREATMMMTQMSAFTQMWVYSTYEIMRVWRDRLYKFKTYKKNGALNDKIKRYELIGDEINMQKSILRGQLVSYRDDPAYSAKLEHEWSVFADAYKDVELLRMNLAKHAAPGNDQMLVGAPGYCRLDFNSGSMQFMTIDKEGNYTMTSRRDIADNLRYSFDLLAGAEGSPENI